MLTKCNENCIETEDAAGGISQEIPCVDVTRTDCVILGEDMNLCSIDVKSTDSLKKIIQAFDKVLCDIKNKTIEVVYNDIIVAPGSCITKELVTDPITNHRTIKFGIDKTCLCNTVDSCNDGLPPVSPFIISASKYSICGNQTATLTSGFSNTIWYNQSGTQIGTGATKTISTGGNYYAVHDGKVSNIINIVYTAVCNTYSYTKIKNFYKNNCPAGTVSSEYTYSKIYTSEISYQDAVDKATADSTQFDNEGQSVVNATGACIGTTPTPITTTCFNVFLSNPNCNVNLPTPTPVSPTPVGTPTTPTPIGSPIISCNLQFSVSNISCNTTPISPTPSPTVNNVVDVFLFAGESNAGTKNLLSTASTGDLGIRSVSGKTIRILNNNNLLLEQIDIPNNSSYGEIDCVPQSAWGWEVPACNLFLANQLITQSNNEVIILKTAQGGSLIGQYNSDIPGGNYSITMSRINAVRSQLSIEGKVAKFHIFYSQGINNMLAPSLNDPAHFPGLTGAEYWKAATLVYLNELILNTGSNTKICLTKFGGTFTAYNSKIDEIVSANSGKYYSVSTTDLTLQPDGLHWDAPSTKTLFRRMCEQLSLTSIVTPTTLTPSNNNGVTIVEPNRPANYYKAQNGVSIITDYQYSTLDNVYLSNSNIKLGINLRYGGAISYLSKADSNVNLVNNGYDGGRQIQPDYYQNPTNYTQNGKTQTPQWNANGYNTTLGGDYTNNAPTLLDYYPVTNGYYLKLRPLLWSFDAELSQIEIGVTYTLIGESVKCEYTYTNKRTDNQIPSGVQLKGWALPVAYMNENFTQIYSYTGNSPFTNDSLSMATIPSGTGSSVNGEYTSKEYWAALYNPSSSVAVGFYNKIAGKSDCYFQFKRENINPGTPNTEFADACCILQVLDTVSIPDSTVQWSRTDTAYIVVADTVSSVRNKIYQINS